MREFFSGAVKVSTAPMVVANTPADPRFQRLVEHLHDLGPRPVGEFLLELVANDPDMGAAVQVNLERYHRLNTATVRALGGDQWPGPPIHEVR